jgi:hypothetical protein
MTTGMAMTAIHLENWMDRNTFNTSARNMEDCRLSKQYEVDLFMC